MQTEPASSQALNLEAIAASILMPTLVFSKEENEQERAYRAWEAKARKEELEVCACCDEPLEAEAYDWVDAGFAGRPLCSAECQNDYYNPERWR